jgi:hypothetical protein
VVDYFTPYNQQSLSDQDLDLGSGGVVLLPDQSGPYPHELVGAAKQGTIYVVSRDNMGRFDPKSDHVVQEIDNALPEGSYDTRLLQRPGVLWRDSRLHEGVSSYEWITFNLADLSVS